MRHSFRSELPAPALGARESASPASFSCRLGAICEVAAAFVSVHVSFRAVKQLTAVGRFDVSSGLNFTPGVVMILFTVAVLLVCRRNFSEYGLTISRWGEGLRLGLLCGLVLIGGAGLLMLLRIHHQAGGPPPTMREGIAYGLASLVALLIFARLARRQRQRLNCIPSSLCVAFLIGLFCLPMLLAWYYERPLTHTFLTVAWLVIGAGIGEEVFYRGYIQSRINEVFGLPFRLWGVQFGAGLLVSSVLFGFLHTLNSVDYFHCRFTFAWGYGVAAFALGLIYGCLREASGSVLAGAVTHSILDVLARVPTLMP